MEVAVRELASLQSATIEATAVVVEAAADDLPTTDYNAAYDHVSAVEVD